VEEETYTAQEAARILRTTERTLRRRLEREVGATRMHPGCCPVARAPKCGNRAAVGTGEESRRV
jgi:hypothetical protein